MQRHLVNDHSLTSSHIHRLDARIKIVAVLLFIVAVVTTDPRFLLAFIIYGGSLLWIIALARLPLFFLLRRAAVVLPFSVLAGAALPLTYQGPEVSFAGFHLSVSGLWLFEGLLVKSMLSVTALLTLVATTPVPKLLAGLRQMRVSPLFLDVTALTIRYLSVLVDEAQRLRRAASARGYKPSWLRQAATLGQLIGHLFVRSYERSERLYAAMRLRGYGRE